MKKQTNLKNILSLRFHDEIERENIIKPHEIKLEDKDFAPKIDDDQLLDRIRGSMIGMATGDALGAHVEFRPRSYLIEHPVKDLEAGGTWGLDKGQFTDDTSMALCLANSLLIYEDFEPYDQLLRYKWWYRYGYMSSTGHCFDIGAATRQSIQEFEKRQRTFAEFHQMNLEDLDSLENPDLFHEFPVNCSHDGVAGNGALMRLTPVPLFFFRNPIKAIEYSGISAKITHGDKKAIDACRFYCALIIAALQGTNKDDLLKDTFYDQHIQWFANDPIHQDILNIAKGSFKKQQGYDDGIRGKGYVVKALEAALWAFWQDNNSFEKGVLDAINLGDDTDTTAAIYGQLAGAVYGFNKLPSKWTQYIYAKDFILFISNWIAFSGLNWHKQFNQYLTNNNQLINTHSIEQKFSSLYRTTSFILPSIEKTIFIEKKAIDSQGQVGLFYNMKFDSICQLNGIEVEFEEKKIIDPIINSFIKKGNENECQNLLRLIGFDDQFRLNILSNLIQPKGIASIVNYPFIIDQHTTIIYYSIKTRQQQISKQQQQSSLTDFINTIYYGIDLVVILRLPLQSTNEFDQILQEFSRSSFQNINLLDNQLFNKILSTNVYSNIPNLMEQKTIQEIFYYVSTIIDKCEYHWPCSYLIQSNSRNEFISKKSTSNIENILLKLASVQKIYSTIFNINNQSELKDQFEDIHIRLNELNQQSEKEKERVKQYLLNESDLNILFSEHELKTLNINIDDFIFRLNDLKEKQDFICDLNRKQFIYWNILQHYSNTKDNLHQIEQFLIKNYPKNIFVCSNDFLNMNNLSELNQILNQLTNSRKQLIYLDFTYSTYELNQITILPLDNSINNQQSNSNSISLQTKTIIRKEICQDKQMNILLLGKFDVGKSTLINNFANFIKFDSYEQIQQSKSFLQILVPFFHRLINNENEEHFISIGNHDQNENFHSSHQSKTRRCRLHHFTLKNSKQKLNLIDTPGFGKTNNSKDDDITMQQILSTIINLTHLDAICIVIQTNEIHLQSYQTCLHILFNLFGEKIQKNIFFFLNKCLTTNFNRNDQINLINKLIEPFKQKNIHWNQNNIFSFDSTYFQQLTLLNYFSNINLEKCQQSWTISYNGWNQLIDHLNKNVQPFILYQGLQTKELFSIEIKRLVRPILETLRNDIRNSILIEKGYHSYFIDLNPITNNVPSAICYLCPRKYDQYGSFWITRDIQHQFDNHCQTCLCASFNHFSTDYTIHYTESINQQLNLSLNEYLQLILQLACFVFNEESDPFLTYFEFMIEEEKYISINLDTHSFNRHLYNKLVIFKQEYQKRLFSLLENKTFENNLNIDQIIELFKEIPLIKKQLKASNQF